MQGKFSSKEIFDFSNKGVSVRVKCVIKRHSSYGCFVCYLANALHPINPPFVSLDMGTKNN